MKQEFLIPDEGLIIIDCSVLKSVYIEYLEPYLTSPQWLFFNIENGLMGEFYKALEHEAHPEYTPLGDQIGDTFIPTDIRDSFFDIFNGVVTKLIDYVEFCIKGKLVVEFAIGQNFTLLAKTMIPRPAMAY